MHTPVLLEQVIEALEIKKDGFYIDATFGEGGYSQAILDKGGKVLGIDFDKDQISNFQLKVKNLKLVEGNFGDIEEIAKANNFFPVDAVVFDLGLSMRQLNQSGRGFSFKKFNEPLDMRINMKLETKASDLVNRLSESELYEVFARNSEEINSKIIARKIIEERQYKKLATVNDLISCIDKAIGDKDNNIYKRIFQALRIAVNQEFDNLKKGLVGGFNLINKEGKIVVISFHSLEDRIVKNFSKSKGIKLLFKKPIMNRRGKSFERSAKLRILVKNNL